jgi:hypothetical protein
MGAEYVQSLSVLCLRSYSDGSDERIAACIVSNEADEDKNDDEGDYEDEELPKGAYRHADPSPSREWRL